MVSASFTESLTQIMEWYVSDRAFGNIETPTNTILQSLAKTILFVTHLIVIGIGSNTIARRK